MRRMLAVWFASIVGMSLIATGFSVGAGDDEDEFKARLIGFEETPVPISTTGRGRFAAELSEDRTFLSYQLTYSGLQGNVLFAHIHFGQKGVTGGVSAFLCEPAPPAAGQPAPPGVDPFPEGDSRDAPTCPQSGTVVGIITAAKVIGPSGQGIAAGEFSELLRAMRAGVTYANVHSTIWPGGEIRGQIQDD